MAGVLPHKDSMYLGATNNVFQLITNADGRLSTTAFIQFFGALLMAGILVFCVWLNRSYVPELFTTFAIFAAVARQPKASPMRCKAEIAKGQQ